MKIIDINNEEYSVLITIDGEKMLFTKHQLIDLIRKNRNFEKVLGVLQAQNLHSSRQAAKDTFSLMEPSPPLDDSTKNPVARIAAVLREMMKNGTINEQDQKRLTTLLHETIDAGSVPKVVRGKLGFTLQELARQQQISEQLKQKIGEFLQRFPQMLNTSTIVGLRG